MGEKAGRERREGKARGEKRKAVTLMKCHRFMVCVGRAGESHARPMDWKSFD